MPDSDIKGGIFDLAEHLKQGYHISNVFRPSKEEDVQQASSQKTQSSYIAGSTQGVRLFRFTLSFF